MDIPNIQKHLRKLNLSSWLLYDFRGLNPISQRVAGLTKQKITRRWFCCIFVDRSPIWLIQHIEQSQFRDVVGEVWVYRSWQELTVKLTQLLTDQPSVAMEYSPNIPYVSRVDAGTLELVKSFGTEVTSSAELVQNVEAKFSMEQLSGHHQTAQQVLSIKTDAFKWIGKKIKNGQVITEYIVQQRIMADFETYGLVTDFPPIVAVNANTADPHYSPTISSHNRINEGDLVLIDLWAKKNEQSAIFADTTWIGYVGTQVPDKYNHIFGIVCQARDKAVELIRLRILSGKPVCGFEVDDVVRKYIINAGYGDYFPHRTGHSIGTEVHGNGVNMDNFESKDERQLIEGCCFSIEPGIYFTGDFGVRTEINVFLAPADQGGVVISTAPVQNFVVPLL